MITTFSLRIVICGNHITRVHDQYQGIDCSNDRNVTKLRLGGADATEEVEDRAIADCYRNRFCIPLDCKVLESHMPFCPSALKDGLVYEITFASYDKIVTAEEDSAASYKIENICLEYQQVTDSGLARRIRDQYAHETRILYERVLRHKLLKVKKSDTTMNVNINIPAKSFIGVLLLFQEPSKPYACDPEKFKTQKSPKLK